MDNSIDSCIGWCGMGLYMYKINKMKELEEQKIMLTKELERVNEEINYYGLDKISEGNGEFKKLLAKRDNIERKIKEIKGVLDNN